MQASDYASVHPLHGWNIFSWVDFYRLYCTKLPFRNRVCLRLIRNRSELPVYGWEAPALLLHFNRPRWPLPRKPNILCAEWNTDPTDGGNRGEKVGYKNLSKLAAVLIKQFGCPPLDITEGHGSNELCPFLLQVGFDFIGPAAVIVPASGRSSSESGPA